MCLETQRSVHSTNCYTNSIIEIHKNKNAINAKINGFLNFQFMKDVIRESETTRARTIGFQPNVETSIRTNNKRLSATVSEILKNSIALQCFEPVKKSSIQEN